MRESLFSYDPVHDEENENCGDGDEVKRVHISPQLLGWPVDAYGLSEGSVPDGATTLLISYTKLWAYCGYVSTNM